MPKRVEVSVDQGAITGSKDLKFQKAERIVQQTPPI